MKGSALDGGRGLPGGDQKEEGLIVPPGLGPVAGTGSAGTGS